MFNHGAHFIPLHLLPTIRWAMRPSSKAIILSSQSVYYSSGKLAHLTPISIVFIHGLQGHRRDTWTTQGICWPKDWLVKEPALSNVRILSFGYDSRGHASLNSLFKPSISFLNGLCRERDDTVSLFYIEFDADSRLDRINRVGR